MTDLAPIGQLMHKKAIDYGEESAVEVLQRIGGRNDFDREAIMALELTRAYVAGALHAFGVAQTIVVEPDKK